MSTLTKNASQQAILTKMITHQKKKPHRLPIDPALFKYSEGIQVVQTLRTYQQQSQQQPGTTSDPTQLEAISRTDIIVPVKMKKIPFMSILDESGTTHYAPYVNTQ